MHSDAAFYFIPIDCLNIVLMRLITPIPVAHLLSLPNNRIMGWMGRGIYFEAFRAFNRANHCRPESSRSIIATIWPCGVLHAPMFASFSSYGINMSRTCPSVVLSCLRMFAACMHMCGTGWCGGASNATCTARQRPRGDLSATLQFDTTPTTRCSLFLCPSSLVSAQTSSVQRALPVRLPMAYEVDGGGVYAPRWKGRWARGRGVCGA